MARSAPVPNMAPIPGMCPGVIAKGGNAGGSGDSSGDGTDGSGSAGAGANNGETDPAADGKAAPAPGTPTCNSKGEPVDVVTGRAYTLPIVDFELAGPIPLRFTRVWSSKVVRFDYGLGHGWAHSFCWRLEVHRRFVRVFNDAGTFVDVPLPKLGFSTVGPWGWVVARESDGGFSVDVDDGMHRYFDAVDDQHKIFRLRALVDRNHNRIELFYADGRLTRVVDSAGRVIRVESTKDRHIAAFQLVDVASGNVHELHRYEHDENASLVRAIDPDGFAAIYAYDPAHRMTEATDRTGVTFHYRYDERGRCIETWGDGEPVIRSLAEDVPVFLSDGQTLAKGIHHYKLRYYPKGYSEVISVNRASRYFGNARGTVDKAIDGRRPWSYEYDARGFLSRKTDPVDASTSYAHDDRGRVLGVTDPLGRSTTMKRDERGLLLQLVDPRGGIFTIERDACGNAVHATGPTGATTSYVYDGRGSITELTYPDGARVCMQYDAQANLVAVVQPNGGTHRHEYDALGRRVLSVDPVGSTTRYRYSPRGDCLAVQHADGSVTDFSYDGERQVTRIDAPSGRTTSFEWGGYRRLCKRTDPLGGTLHMAYGRTGETLEIANEAGDRYHLRYDSFGQLIREDTFDGRAVHHRYDAAGRRVRTAWGDAWVAFEYDEAAQLVAREDADGRREELAYDARGDLIRIAGDGVLTCFERDALGQVIAETQEHDGRKTRVESRYDTRGRRIAMSTSLGHREEIERDSFGARRSTTIDGVKIEHTMDLLGREVRRTLPDGGSIDHEYDVFGRVAAISVAPNHARRQTEADHPEWVGRRDDSTIRTTFTYAPGGERASTADTKRGSTRYAHDALGRILEVVDDAGVREAYAYDTAGNLHDKAGPLRDFGPGNQLRKRGDTDYAWDESGRMESETRGDTTLRSFRWTPLGNLQEIADEHGRRLSFDYDSMARRIAKTEYVVGDDGEQRAIAKTRYAWDGDTLVHATRDTLAGSAMPMASSQVTFSFEDDGLHPIAQSDGRTLFAVNDPVGSPDRFVDAGGQIAGEVERTVWGMPTEADEHVTPIGFPGQLADDETGLSYNRYRYYDPSLGQYLSADPIGLRGGFNTFKYVDDPLRTIDALGLVWNTRPEFDAAHAGHFSSPTESNAAWGCYRQNYESCQDPALGRIADTGVAAGMGHEVLNNPNWTPRVNDAWVQGGIDRRAPFYLASPATPANRVNPPGSPYPTTVFDRELNQLGAGWLYAKRHWNVHGATVKEASRESAVDRAIELVLRIEEGQRTVLAFEPVPNPVDHLCGELADLYAIATSAERDAIRQAGTPTQMRVLVTFGQRMAILAVRTGQDSCIRHGVLAQAIEDFRWDPRETSMTLTLLHDAALKLGGDPSSWFTKAAALASTEAATYLRAFAANPASLASMGFVESKTDYGFFYARTW